MHYFGTDGIRAKADELLEGKIAYYLGCALANTDGKIIVARDVRTHSPLIEKQLCEGLLTGRAEIWLAGVLPTPALAYTAKTEGAEYAVMITASHNAPQYNGLKVFGKDGQKLALAKEAELDEAVLALCKRHRAESPIQAATESNSGSEVAADLAERTTYNDLVLQDSAQNYTQDSAALKLSITASIDNRTPKCNRIHILEGAEYLYCKHIKSMFPRLDGFKVRLDCAYGCMAQLAVGVFEALGAAVVAENDIRDGEKVNVECGSTYINDFIPRVKSGEIGFAFDGDGDRVLCVANGKLYDGDAMLLALSTLYRLQGKLRNKFVVGTLLTNSRLQRELAYQGTALVRADVGDKYVLDALRDSDCLLGGEKSGHIIMLDRAETGDGLITALSVLEVKKTIGSLPKFSPYPTKEYNIPCQEPSKAILCGKFSSQLAKANEIIGTKGRVLLRPSGTEPCVRLAIECFSEKNCSGLFERIKELFE